MSTYRDATYSLETQERLRRLLEYVQAEDDGLDDVVHEGVQALTDVIERWDANDATEVTF